MTAEETQQPDDPDLPEDMRIRLRALMEKMLGMASSRSTERKRRTSPTPGSTAAGISKAVALPAAPSALP